MFGTFKSLPQILHHNNFYLKTFSTQRYKQQQKYIAKVKL